MPRICQQCERPEADNGDQFFCHTCQQRWCEDCKLYGETKMYDCSTCGKSTCEHCANKQQKSMRRNCPHCGGSLVLVGGE